MNQLEIPVLNPLHFVDVTPTQSALYNTHYYEDYLFEDTIFFHLEQKRFFQIYRIGDSIKLQMTSNFAPLFLEVQNEYGQVVFSANMSQVRENKYEPGSFLYELTIALSGSAFPAGWFRAFLTPGGNTAAKQKSEWFCLQTDQDPTVLVEYYNNKYHGDVIFETGIKFSMRVPGFVESNAPGSKDILYQDQVLDNTQLSSKPFRNFTFWVGDGTGVPPWLIDKLNFAFSCSNVYLDGKLFAKSSGGWEETTEEGDPLKGYSLKIQPGINRSSKIINPGIDPNKKITFVSQIAADVFGSVDSQGGNITIPVTSFG